MPEAPKLHFNPFTEEALNLGFEIQMCLVLIKACAVFPVPSHWTNTKDARIHHKYDVERVPQSTFISASGGETSADLQSAGEGESRALAWLSKGVVLLGGNCSVGLPGSLHSGSILSSNCSLWLLKYSLEGTTSWSRRYSYSFMDRALNTHFYLLGQFMSSLKGRKWPEVEAGLTSHLATLDQRALVY